MKQKLISKLFILTIITTLACSCGKEAPEVKFARAMDQANEFIKAGKWEEARISLLNAIAAKSDDANSHYQLAESYMRLKKIGPAIDQYETALNLQPTLRDARIKIAAIKLGGNAVEAAESDIVKLLEENPEDPEALMLKASVSKMSNRLPEAVTILEKLIAKNPNNNLALAALGDVNLALGKSQIAEDLFNRSLKIDSQNSAVRLALADLYVKQNRLDEAQGIIENLISKDPANTTLRFYLGEFLLARGSAEKATEQYRELLKADPKRHEARDRLYDLLVLKRENDKARELTAELFRLEPSQPNTIYFQGRDLELSGKIGDALALYLKAIEGLPSFAPLFRHAGLIELALGKTHEGVEHLNQAISINGVDVGARIALARNYFLNRDFAQAKEQVEQVLKNFPRQIGANIIRADIALVEKDLPAAESVYRALAETLLDNPIGYFKLGALEESRQNTEAAIANYRNGLKLDQDVLIPSQRIAELMLASKGLDQTIETLVELRDQSKNNKAEYNVILGSVLINPSRGKPSLASKAREFLTLAVEEKPDLLPAYFSLAQLNAVEGKLQESESSYKKILEKQPSHIPSRMLLAMSYEMRGEKDPAIEEYRKIIALNPNLAAAANNLAWLIAITGKGTLDEALDLALKAKEKLPQVAAVADTLGYIYFKRDTPKAALAILEEAAELDRKNAPEGAGGTKLVNPEILFHLAAVQNALDMKNEAKKTAREAIKLVSETATFYNELKKIAE